MGARHTHKYFYYNDTITNKIASSSLRFASLASLASLRFKSSSSQLRFVRYFMTKKVCVYTLPKFEPLPPSIHSDK